MPSTTRSRTRAAASQAEDSNIPAVVSVPDEEEEELEDDVTLSVQAEATGSSLQSSTRPYSQRNPLPEYLLKQLLEDVEAYGGRANFAGSEHKLKALLNHLCDHDEIKRALYKDQKDPIRRKIQLKVLGWQKLSATDYLDLLAQHSVTECKFRRTVQQVPPTPTRSGRRSSNASVQSPPPSSRPTAESSSSLSNLGSTNPSTPAPPTESQEQSNMNEP